ncbi:hypothetical protein KAR91_87955 [Candidatus Pacearchaeota archaeon]|nr:hypothetical protein [Candidatus Pacearchaeota archaeon]
MKETKFDKVNKPKSVNEWIRLLPKGLFYTATQVSVRALIKPVTARRWLQHGHGSGILEMKESGIVKRFRVKENVTKSSKPGNQKASEGDREQESQDLRGTVGDLSEGVRSNQDTSTEEGRRLVDQSSNVSSETKRSWKSSSSDRKGPSD